jgi:hypothetical protein
MAPAREPMVILKAVFISVLTVMMATLTSAAAETSITFVGASPLADSNSPVTTVRIALPAGVQPGDTLLAQIVVWDGTGSDVPAPPTGWTGIRHDAVSNGNKIASWLFYRVAGANEPGSFGWSISAQYAAGVIGAWRGASLSPIDQASGTAKGGASPLSLAAPSLVPTNSSELQVYFYGAQSGVGPAITLAGAVTQRLNVISSKEGFSLAYGDLAAPSAGSASPTYFASAKLAGGAPAMSAQAILLVPASQSNEPSPTATPTASATRTAIPTVTFAPTATATAMVTSSPTTTRTAISTATPVASATPTIVATGTATAMATPASTPVSSAIIFVGASSLADSSSPLTTVNVSLPAGVQSGDTLLAQIVIWDGSASDVPTPPAGWTNIRHDVASNGNKLSSWLYYKVAGANEPGSFGWSISSQWAAGVMGAWRNASLSPIDNSSGLGKAGSSPLSDSAPSLTPANNNELQVYFYGAQASAGPAITLPGAIAQRFDAISSKEGFSLGLGDLAAPSQGTASPTYAAIATLAGNAPAMTAQAILLIPAAQSGSPIYTRTATPTPVSSVDDVLTYHNDNARTGQYLSEQILTPLNVNSSSFGKLFELPLDGKVDGQPLIKTQLSIPGKGTHNVLYVVTENDTVYAFDADNGSTVWPALSLLGAHESPSDNRSCGQVTPQIGITSTPVIDPSAGPHGTIYIVAMSKDASNNYLQRIHALDLTTGAEEFGGPLTVTASYAGTGAGSKNGQVPFVPGQYKERAGLLLLNGVVYTTWASHCDIGNYTGWIIAYAVNQQNTLVQTSILNVTPNGGGGAIWNSGAGPAVDSSGNIYFLDANGTFDTTLTAGGFPLNNDFGNAFIKLSTSSGLQVADYFNMSNTVSESGGDVDLGSGGALVLPDMTDASGKTRHLAVGAGKDSNIYVVDRDNMGKFNPSGNSNVYQELSGALPGGEWAMPAFFGNTLYYGGVNAPLRAYKFSQARLNSSASSSTTETFSYPGTTPSISANGTNSAIVWTIEASGNGVLHAYDASNLANELYDSNQASNGRDSFQDNKFVTPTIANGKVYVGTPNSVAVFGLLP